MPTGISFDATEPHHRLVEVVCRACREIRGFEASLCLYAHGGSWYNPDRVKNTRENPEAEPWFIGNREVWQLVVIHLNEEHSGIPADLEATAKMATGLGDCFGALRYLDEHKD